jgi:hypothetical protein
MKAALSLSNDMWTKVAEYCDNDVIATEAVFNARKSDFLARQILSDVAGMTVNDTTNTLTTRIIFENNRKPQDRFNYRDMGCHESKVKEFGSHTVFAANVLGYVGTKLPYFLGYKFENWKSTII